MDYATWEKYKKELAAATERNGNLAVELAAVKLERDSLRREVAALVDMIAIYLCPPRKECVRGVDEVTCCDCWAAWAKQQAAQAGKDVSNGEVAR